MGKGKDFVWPDDATNEISRIIKLLDLLVGQLKDLKTY